ncbi:MAG: hypothetical protein II718_02625 [Clostridiales bacterium]|nr:hypothetical protein [Clostridiales bacterium]
MALDTGISKKCPGCAGNLLYDENIRKMMCRVCGNIYDPKTMRSDGNMAVRDTGASDEADKRSEFICDNCGAVVVADETTAAAFCPFCASPSIIKRRLSHEFRPDYIIPFKVNKEVAKQNVIDFIKSEPKAPRSLLKNKELDKLRGIYVPFWLIKARCHTDVAGSGVTIEDTSIKTVYNVDRTIHFTVKNVPFDGSKKIDNILMEAVEPFDFDDLVEYSDNYIPGFYAQRYDESAMDMTARIQSRLYAHARQFGKYATAEEYKEVRVNSDFSDATDFSQSYALLPIWFTSVKYNNQRYDFVVNGQTGKATGELPTDPVKQGLKVAFFKWILPGLVIASFVLGLLLNILAFSIAEEYAIVLLAFALILFFAGFTSVKYFWKWILQKRKDIEFDSSFHMDPPPTVEHFIDYKQKIEMEKRDSPGFVVTYGEEGERDYHTF